VTGTGRSN